jgi:Golgi nucleoside diphosphatase
VRTFLLDKSRSPFLFRPSWAKIIPGNEEGGFGWIAFNYLKRIIGPKKNPQSLETPFAVVEMGGASSQVSQAAPTPAAAAAIPEKYRFTFTIEKEIYQLYTHSYLGYGAEQAREQLNKALVASTTTAPVTSAPPAVKDPCTNPGYTKAATEPVVEPYQGPSGVVSVGASNTPDAGFCEASLSMLFHQVYATAQSGVAAVAHLASAVAAAATTPAANTLPAGAACNPSTHPGPHSFGCIYQPDFVTQSSNFLVFENFYYMASGLAVQSVVPTNTSTTAFPLRTTPAHILEATNKVCSLEWDALKATYPLDQQPKDVALKMCFSGSYAYSFLVDGLKIPVDKVLTVQKAVGDSEIEWALGAAYKEAAEMLKRTNLRPT